MKYFLIALLFPAMLFTGEAPARQSAPGNRPLNAEQWRADLRCLYDSLKSGHASLFHYTSKGAFDKKYLEIYNEIPMMSREKIFLRFQQFISLAGDGHTMLLHPGRTRRFPLDFFIFGNKIVLVKSDTLYRQVLGLELIRVNNHPIREIMDSLSTIVVHGESSAYILKQKAERLPLTGYLESFGFVDESDSSAFLFRNGRNKIKIKVAATPVDEKDKSAWQWAYNPLPLFLRSGGRNCSSTHQPGRVLY